MNIYPSYTERNSLIDVQLFWHDADPLKALHIIRLVTVHLLGLYYEGHIM